jgi:hypothetical protein
MAVGCTATFGHSAGQRCFREETKTTTQGGCKGGGGGSNCAGTLSRRMYNQLKFLDIGGQRWPSAHPVQNEGSEVAREDAPLIAKACRGQIAGLNPAAHRLLRHTTGLHDIHDIQHRFSHMFGLTCHDRSLRLEEKGHAPGLPFGGVAAKAA